MDLDFLRAFDLAISSVYVLVQLPARDLLNLYEAVDSLSDMNSQSLSSM